MENKTMVPTEDQAAAGAPEARPEPAPVQTKRPRNVLQDDKSGDKSGDQSGDQSDDKSDDPGTDPSTPTEPQKSMVDLLYDEINNVLGGSNQNQYLCLTFPGTLLDASNYRYDTKTQSKPLTVQASESELTNKLFDACQVTGADNGRSLAQQYGTALGMLTPKLNPDTVDAKNALRDMLMTPYPYDFGQGLVTDLNLQQVFFRLYDEWVAEKQRWAKVQQDEQAKLDQKYPDSSEQSNQARQNAYLQWYEMVADGYLEKLNECYSKILAVFSPADMKILEGVLDSGSGAELEEARETMNNIRRANPNGGYIYPVNLQPSNWFELLDTSFTGVDLLDSPETLSEQMYLLTSEKSACMTQIRQISAAIPDNKQVQAALTLANQARGAVDDAEKSLVSTYGDGVKAVFDAVMSIETLTGGITHAVVERLVVKSNIQGPDKPVSEIVDKITGAINDVEAKQTAYVNAMSNLAAADAAAVQAKGMEQLAALLTPLQDRADRLDEEINALGRKIALSQAVQDANGTTSTAPNRIPNGYTSLTIQANASSMNSRSEKSASSSVSSTGVPFLFGGYTQKNEASTSVYNSFTSDNECKIEIGMAVAKVSIQRDWFNPGLFTLSGDMCNVTNQKIAPAKSYPDGFDDEKRFREMNACVFPCFPTAFVVARDVTVKITTSEEVSQQSAYAMEQHASKGGGFLFFRGSSATSSSSSQSSAHVSSNGKCINIRFTSPQILGYYMEATPGDYSSPLSGSGDDFVTVLEFVQKYKEVLEAHAAQQKGTQS